MPCLVLLFAFLSPRLAVIITWLFSNVMERAYDGFIVPILLFLFLPWTMLAYAWMYDSGRDVVGIEWFLVGLAFLIDLGSVSRRHARPPRRPRTGRRAEEVALGHRAAELAQQPRLCLVLDALGDDAEPERRRHRHHRRHDRRVLRRAAEVGHERAVDLDRGRSGSP